MSFNDLPLEIKQTIWRFALHAAVDEPEICIVWPLKAGCNAPISKPLLVDTAFPVLMHVCGQWRNFVLSSSQRPSSPVKFRFSRQADCQVPYRHFRASTDILYLSAMNQEEATRVHDMELHMEWETGVPKAALAPVRHLAVEWPLWLNAGNWLPALVYRVCPNLEKVSVVFSSSRMAILGCFRAPAKRCKLRRVEGADKLLVAPDWDPEKLEPLQSKVDNGVEHLHFEAMFKWEVDLQIHELDMDEPDGEWFVGSAWDKKQQKFCLEYEAATFVQYKRSEIGGETWFEACEDRLIEWEECFDNPNRRCPSPTQLAINPEEWRVNDEEGYPFRLPE